MEYGCGQCMPCRINRQRQWVGRLQLELATSPLSAFVTLTYSDDNIPIENGQAVLKKEDVQLWLKRLREKIYPRKCRYFLVGEYGDRTYRPHYHLILYGVSSAESELLSSSWTLGFVHVGTPDPAALSYVCGYVTKKMTSKKDPRLNGKPPEFTLMSRKPGIGVGALPSIAAAYRTVSGKAHIEQNRWVGREVRIQGKKYPLGRYLMRKLTDSLGLDHIERQAQNVRVCQEVYTKKSALTTVAYERSRKALVQQQEGKIALKTGVWRKTF